jgi:hypothetical protein
MAYAHNNGRSIPELFTEVVTQLTTLLRKEGQLARAEIVENVGKVAAGLGLIVGGAVLLIPGLVVVLQAVVAALIANGMQPYWAAAIVGGVVLVVGLILLMVGMNRLKADRMIPNRTINQLQQDASVAKDQVRQRHDLHRAA